MNTIFIVILVLIFFLILLLSTLAILRHSQTPDTRIPEHTPEKPHSLV